MSILNTLFDKTPSDNIIKSLGNIIISGVENDGVKTLYEDILTETLKKKQTFMLINGSISKDEYDTLINTVRPFMIGRCAYDFNFGTSSDAMDVFSAFDSAEEKSDFVVLALDSVLKMPDTLKVKAKRFYYYAIDILDKAGKIYKFADILKLDNEYIVDVLETLSLDEFEKNRRKRFLSDASMYSAFMDIETAAIQIESYGLADKFSGTDMVKDVLHNGNAVLMNAFITEDFKKNEIFLNLFTYVLKKALEKYKAGDTVSIIVKEADYISGDYIKNIFEYNNTYNFASYMLVDDISRYIGKMGNDILDKTKSFIVFTQGSDDNASFWSAFFGSRDVNERSYSYTKKKSFLPFSSAWGGGGVIDSPRKYSSTTSSFQKVNKPIYRPEIFRELKSNEVMCYLREPLIRRKLRIGDEC